MGVETGYFTNARQYVEDDSVQKEVIEINAQPIGTDPIQEVRGAYLVTLPQFKRIQLEIDYELPITDESGVQDEYYVEVFERNQLNRDEWVSIKTIKQNEELKTAPLNILESKNEKFSVTSYVANLSQWAGREIRLDLVSHIQKNSNMKPGRWTRLRLVGATFDYKFIDFDQTTDARGLLSPLSVRESRNKLQYDPYVSPGYASYVIPDLNFYADTGPAPAFINNRWIAYFNANYRPPRNISVDGRAHGGSMTFDLVNNATYNLYTLVPGVAINGLLRLIGGVPMPSSNTNYTPYATIAPYRPSNPLATPMTWKLNWDNGYTGVNSAFVATNSGITRVHAFLHVEDWFKNIYAPNFLYNLTSGLNDANSDNEPDYVYSRIGYARSDHNLAYPLKFKRCGNDVSSPTIYNASPIIECFQKEGDHQEIGVCGASGPAIIISEPYIYLFYTRQVSPAWIEDPTKSGFSPDTITSLGIYQWNTVCVARALKESVVSESYEAINQSSPWKKFYAGSFDHENNVNAGIGGLSTSILSDTGNRVVCNIIYNTYLNTYLMLCWNFITHVTYLYTCNNLATQQWSTGIMLSMPSTEVGIRLVGNSGDDKVGGQNMMFYTRERAYPGYDTILEERALWLEQ